MEWMWDIGIWSSLLTLTVLEIVLGIDNIVFITLLVGKLPEHQRAFARQFGLMAALGTRVLLLMSVAWLAKLVTPLFTVMNHPVSGRDLVLLGGGLFLIYKAVVEIHNSLLFRVKTEAFSYSIAPSGLVNSMNNAIPTPIIVTASNRPATMNILTCSIGAISG